MGGKTTLRALLLEKRGEFIASELTTPVRTQAFNADSTLGLSPCCKGFVCRKSLVL
jgi:hypothetical protein